MNKRRVMADVNMCATCCRRQFNVYEQRASNTRREHMRPVLQRAVDYTTVWPNQFVSISLRCHAPDTDTLSRSVCYFGMGSPGWLTFTFLRPFTPFVSFFIFLSITLIVSISHTPAFSYHSPSPHPTPTPAASIPMIPPPPATTSLSPSV